MVRRGLEGRVKEYLSPHSNESRAGIPPFHRSSVALMAESLVEIQNGFTNGAGRKDDAMEDLLGRFFNASLVRIGQTSELKGEENNGGVTNCNQLVREYVDHEIDPSVYASQGVLDPNKLASKGDGCPKTRRCAYNVERANLGQFERDRIELDLVRENNALSR